MTKFAIVVGHEENLPGAKGVPPLDCYEYEYNKELAAMVSCDLLDRNIQSEIFFRDKIGIAGAYREVNLYDPAGVVELHFNASGINARGTETLYARDASKHLAELVHECIIQNLKRPGVLDRGLKKVGMLDRGYPNLTQTKCPSILTEPFFGDSYFDAVIGKNQKSDLAQGIAEGIHRFIMGVQ